MRISCVSFLLHLLKVLIYSRYQEQYYQKEINLLGQYQFYAAPRFIPTLAAHSVLVLTMALALDNDNGSGTSTL